MAAKIQYDNIQILRGVAAMGVVFDHAAMPYFEGDDTLLYRVLMFAGYIGVWIFFVISGFIMGVTSFGSFGADSAPKSFIKRRFLRIAPLYYLVSLAKYLVVFKKVGVAALLMSLLFIPHFNEKGVVRPILGQGWTLNYEMFFYVLFACAMFAPLKRGLTCLTVAMVTLVVGGAIYRELGGNAENPFFITYTDPIMLLFVAGVGVAYLLRQGTTLSSRMTGLASVALYGLLFAIFLVGRAIPMLEQAVVPVALAATCVCLIFMSAASALSSDVVQRHGLLYKATMKLGDASYSIYLTHTFVLTFFFKVDERLSLGPATIIPLCAAFSIALGLVIYQYVEKPLGGWLSGRRQSRLATA